MKKKKKINRKKLLIIVVALLLVLIITDIIITQSQKNKKIAITNEEVEEIIEEDAIKKLKNKTEIQRCQYYINNFFMDIENRKIEKAYNVLADDFKENYFPTKTDFENYINTYFSKDLNIKTTNYERIGEYYVFWMDIDDIIGNKKSFSLNVVVAEYDYNNYKISFSTDSPIE